MVLFFRVSAYWCILGNKYVLACNLHTKKRVVSQLEHTVHKKNEENNNRISFPKTTAYRYIACAGQSHTSTPTKT